VLDNGQAAFANEGGVSERGRLGVAFERKFEASGFSWTPYGTVSALHEFDGAYVHVINDGLRGTTRTDGTSAQVELGLGARRNGLSFTGGVSWTDGGALESVAAGQLVVRYSW
jgi:outer membrane autotransporter protein